MDVRILGPLEVHEDGRTLDLGGPRPRALFTILLLHSGKVVSVDRLVDELWGETPPRSANHLLHVYVSVLRKQIGSRLVTVAPGYRLDIEPEEVDANRFERLVHEANAVLAAGEPERASAALRDALGLWRGPALAGVVTDRLVAFESARLEELRMAAVEARLDADLALGREAALAGELASLVAADPYRERLRAQLMLALYRCGRQADALAAYQDARQTLVAELGLEPGEELQELQRRILNRDPALAAPRSRRGADAVSPSARRHRWWRPAAAVAAVAAGAIAAAFATVGGGDPPANHQDAVARIDVSLGGVQSFVGVGSMPRNLAYGEGAVWVLNADDRTVSRIDLGSGRIADTFATGATPTELAVGAGAVWVGNGASRDHLPYGNSTVSVSRVDPESGTVTRTVVLPRPKSRTYLSNSAHGVNQLAVGAGAVWAINPDLTVSRIDPRTGDVVATITDTAISPSSGIAAGQEGVWMIGEGASVTRIDPRTNRTAETIGFVATPYLVGIAVGAGSVWATVPEDGVVWRIEPGHYPVTRTVQVGFGVSSVAFAEGSLWAANPLDGTVSQIDPGTNTVARRIRVGGTPQGLAAGGGQVWVSVAGATARGALPEPNCRRVESGGHEPDVLIASDLPLQGFSAAATRGMTDAIRLVLRQRDFRAGRYLVGYASCDDSTARSGTFDFFRCASNGRSFAQANRLVAVIGPYDSDCAQVEINVMNAASNGELALVSPATTYSGLTRAGPGAWASGDDPDRYYPTGGRTFARIPPHQGLQLAASAVLLERLGLRTVFVLYDAGPWGVAAARSFERSAARVGVEVVGARSWDPGAAGHAALARAVARSGAQAVLLDGLGWRGGYAVARDLRRELGSDVVLVGGEGFSPIPELRRVAGRSADGMFVVSPSIPLEGLGVAGRQFLRDLAEAESRAPRAEALQAAQAAAAVLGAIARSDGTRASVLAQLRAPPTSDGSLGGVGFDRWGDVTPARVAIYRVTDRAESERLHYPEFVGAVLDRVITVPDALR